MKIRSVLFGLVVLVCLFGGLSLMSRMNEDQGGWRPADMYSTYGGSQGVTYSSVTYGSASSAGSSVPVLSSSNSLFRHRGVSSYAPVSGFAYSQSPLASSPLTSSPQGGLYTTSSAEFRSFGGGNAGGVSMSGGAIKSSGSAMAAPSSALSVSMPAAPAFAYNRGALSSVAGDMAMASDQAYAGIGNTTGGMNRISGRKNSTPTLGDPWWVWFDSWLSQDSDGNGVPDNGSPYGSNGNYTFDRYTLERAYNDFINSGIWNTGMSETPSFDEWLDWYLQAMSENGYYTHTNGHTYSWLPIGDIWPLVVMTLLYSSYVIFRRRKQKMAINN